MDMPLIQKPCVVDAHDDAQRRRVLGLALLFLATFRRMPTANAEGYIDSEGSIGKVSVRRVFRYLQVDTGPRRSPSACAEKLLKIGTAPPNASWYARVRAS